MDITMDIFVKNQTKHICVPLPPIAPLEATAHITETLQAVERLPACLLLTDPIPCDGTESYTAKNVIFKIESNDQGWSSGDNHEDEYENSQTWFEVAILRPVKQDVRISPRKRNSITSEPCIKKALDEKSISDKLCFVLNWRGSPVWYLQRNRRGNNEPFVHTITWTPNCKELEDERRHFNARTGTGSGFDFVRSLQGGDRVAIIARARESGSVNYVSAATIQISFEGNKVSSNLLTAGATDGLTTHSSMHVSPSSPRTSGKGHASLWATLQIAKVVKAARAPRVARVARIAKAATKAMKAAKAAKVAKFMKAVQAAKVVKAAKTVKQIK